jgi:hypothetical protein
MLPYAINIINIKIKKGGNYLSFIDKYLNLNFYIRILVFFLLIMEFLEVL